MSGTISLVLATPKDSWVRVLNRLTHFSSENVNMFIYINITVGKFYVKGPLCET